MLTLTREAALGRGYFQQAPFRPLVASRPVIANDGSLITGFDRTETRMQFRLGRQAVKNIRFVFANWGVLNNQGGEVDGPSDLTIEAAIENANTAYKTMTFGGAVQYLLKKGMLIETDPAVPSDISLGSFGANGALMGRFGATMATTDTAYGGFAALVTTTGSKEAVCHSTGKASQIQAFGDFTTAGYTLTPVYGFAPIGIVGDWTGLRDIAALLDGDSIMFGAGEASAGAQTGNGQTTGGFGARGLWAVGGSNKTVPWTKLARGGDCVGAAVRDFTRRIQMARYATDVFCNYFYNDIHAFGSTGPQVIADLKTLARLYRERGVRFHWCTAIPGTTSTNAYRDAATQSVDASHAKWATYCKQAVLDGVGGWLDGIVDYDSAIRDATETDKWKTDGTTANLYCSSDAVHPTGTGHAAMGAVLATYANTLTIP